MASVVQRGSYPVSNVSAEQDDPIRKQANALYNAGNEESRRENYESAYHKFLEAQNLYEKMPEGRIKTRDLIDVNRELANLASWVRHKRRYAVGQIVCYSFGSLLACLMSPCLFYYCCKVSCCTEWVEDRTASSYYNRAQQLANGFIEQISRENRIQMGTDKNTIPDEARKDLGYAYDQLGRLYTLSDSAGQECLCLGGSCCCCFNGARGNNAVFNAAQAQSIANYKLAMEWDPYDREYAARFQELDSAMKTPIIHVTNHYH